MIKFRKTAYFFLILCFFFPSALQAQITKDSSRVDDDSQAIGSYTLDACIQYAFQYQEQLKKAQLEVQLAGADIGERLSVGLPQIRARADFNYNFRLQKTIIPGNNPPLNPDPEPLALAFQPKYNGGASITLEQLIFDASYFIGLKGAEMYRDLVKKQIVQSKIDIAEQVSKSFYAVLINEQRLTLLDQNLSRLDTLLKETKALNQNGFAELIDVQRIEVSYNNLKTEKQKTKRLAAFSKQVLKYQMGMSLRDSIILEGSLSDLSLELNQVLASEPDYKSRIEYSLLEYQRELQIVNFRYNKSLYYPRLEAFVTYGANTGANQFGDYFKFQDLWFKYGVMGLSLSIPILDGFKRKHTLQKYRIAVVKAEQDMKIFKQTADFQVEQSKTNLANSLQDLEIQRKNMELATEVSRVAKVKYANGVGSNLEIVDAETSFKEAETNYFSALYESVIYKIDLDKAQGKLMKDAEGE